MCLILYNYGKWSNPRSSIIAFKIARDPRLMLFYVYSDYTDVTFVSGRKSVLSIDAQPSSTHLFTFSVNFLLHLFGCLFRFLQGCSYVQFRDKELFVNARLLPKEILKEPLGLLTRKVRSPSHFSGGGG